MTSRPVPARSPDPFADRRAYPRVTIALPAFLQANGERHAAQLIDLSSGGAKLDCPAAVLAGTAVTLDCGSFSCAATVRWQNAQFLGLCFDCELDGREVAALIGRSNALAARIKARD